MRLISIAVRNYRIHRELKIGLDPSRNLIGGPNESGKSTLAEAVHRALFLKAKGNTEFHRAMVSSLHSGHPEVEVHFESGGVAYHLKKRFGSTGTTTLTPANAIPLAGEAAETELARVLGVDASPNGKAASAQWSHLWVWQGQSGNDPTEHANQHQASLVQRLQQSGGAAAMQSAADERVAQHFSDLTGSIYTQAGKPKAGSELERAETAASAAEAEQRIASERLEKSLQAVRDFEDASASIASAADNIRTLERQKAETAAKLVHAEELRREEIERSNAAKSAKEKHAALDQGHRQILELRQKAAELTAALAPQQAQAAQLVEARNQARHSYEKADREYESNMADARAARLRRELAGAWLARFEKTARLEELSIKALQVKALETDLAAHKLSLAQLPEIDATKLKKLQKLESSLTTAGAALQAMAAGLELISSDETVLVGGSPMGMGESRVLTEEIEITAGGNLRLRLRPGGGTSLASARKEALEAKLGLQKALDDCGITTVAEAADIVARRADLGAKILLAESGLASLKADSLPSLIAEAQTAAAAAEAEVARRSALVPNATPPDSVAGAKLALLSGEQRLEAIEAEDSRRKAARTAATKALGEAEESLDRHRQTIESQTRAITEHEAQIRLLVENHGDDATRTEKLRLALADRNASNMALGATQSAIAELQPDLLAEDFKRLGRALDLAKTSKTEAETRRAVAQNSLQSDGSIDPEESLALASSRAQSAQEHLASVRRKAAAIRLLAELFLAEQRILADQFTRPLADKISGYLQCLFGAGARANVALTGNEFSGLQLLRPESGGAVPFEVLSGGAQQQVAAAVRLAMAEVLSASHDGCLPIVFDDAFAFSDSERVEKLQRMLDLAASRGLQLIVLSCTPADYASMGARLITIRREKYVMPAPPEPIDDTNLVLVATPPPIPVTDEQRDRLLTILRDLGGKAGNQTLREAIGWDENLYEAVRDDLASRRQIVLGRGRGGSIALPENAVN